jgi:hypothetical protein
VGAVTVALLGWGCAALLVNLACRFPRLDWKTTSQQVSTAAWLLAFPCLGLYAAFCVVLIALYPAAPAGLGQLAALLGALALASLATWFLHREALQTASSHLTTLEG